MFTEKLNEYLIPGALELVNKWCKGYPVLLVVKNARETKLGDYQKLKDKHKITLNSGLDKALSFHILTHEIAHMHAREKYGRYIKPHGDEWKFVFAGLIVESLHLFEPELQKILKDFAVNPRAGFYAYQPLVEYFQIKENPEKIYLKDLEPGTVFKSGKRCYEKGKKSKIRYICRDINTGKKYSVHPLAPVDEIVKRHT